MSTQCWNSAKQRTKKTPLGVLMTGMTLAYVDILLHLINLLNPARDRIELPTRRFSVPHVWSKSQVFQSFIEAFFACCARLCTTDLRKTQARESLAMLQSGRYL